VVENSGTARDLYYSANWQVLEERAGGVTKASYVWSPVYVDAMIARDRPDIGERQYVLQDANFNVTGIVSTAGAVLERYVYDSFGKATVLNPSWGTISGSAYGWVYLHQGLRLDTVSGDYDNRGRIYDPILGRFLNLDPIRYEADDVNLYRYVGNRPTVLCDPFGLKPTPAQQKVIDEYTTKEGYFLHVNKADWDVIIDYVHGVNDPQRSGKYLESYVGKALGTLKTPKYEHGFKYLDIPNLPKGSWVDPDFYSSTEEPLILVEVKGLVRTRLDTEDVEQLKAFINYVSGKNSMTNTGAVLLVTTSDISIPDSSAGGKKGVVAKYADSKNVGFYHAPALVRAVCESGKDPEFQFRIGAPEKKCDTASSVLPLAPDGAPKDILKYIVMKKSN
jgi:RHS repeat-associated protein